MMSRTTFAAIAVLLSTGTASSQTAKSGWERIDEMTPRGPWKAVARASENVAHHEDRLVKATLEFACAGGVPRALAYSPIRLEIEPQAEVPLQSVEFSLGKKSAVGARWPSVDATHILEIPRLTALRALEEEALGIMIRVGEKPPVFHFDLRDLGDALRFLRGYCLWGEDNPRPTGDLGTLEASAGDLSEGIWVRGAADCVTTKPQWTSDDDAHSRRTNFTPRFRIGTNQFGDAHSVTLVPPETYAGSTSEYLERRSPQQLKMIDAAKEALLQGCWQKQPNSWFIITVEPDSNS